MFGDIILVRSSGKSANRNLLGQRLATGRSTKGREYTHVVLVSGPWQAIHAMPAPQHVEIVGLQEILKVDDPTWRAWRHNAFAERLAADDGLKHALHYKLCESLGEAYNGRFVFRSHPEHSFCSQLVGKHVAHWGIPFQVPPHQLMPIDIAAEIEASPHAWSDVTDEYRERLAGNQDYRRLYDNRNLRDANAHRASYFWAKEEANDSLRMFTASIDGAKPQSRVNVETSGGLRVVSGLKGPRPSAHGPSPSVLPDPYHGSVRDWARWLSPSIQWLDEQDYGELMSLSLPVRSGQAPGDWLGRLARHDVALVLARQDVARDAALLFDAVLAWAAGEVPGEVGAWRASVPGRVGLKVNAPDGHSHLIRPGDPGSEAVVIPAILERLYVAKDSPQRAQIAADLRAARVGTPALLVPSGLVDFDAEEEDVVSALAIELTGIELVDIRRVAWSRILRVREDVPTMRGLRALRHLFVPHWTDDSERLPKEAIPAALAAYRTALTEKKLPTCRGSFGVIVGIDDERLWATWRLAEASGPLPDETPLVGLTRVIGGVNLRITPVACRWAALAAEHSTIFVIGRD